MYIVLFFHIGLYTENYIIQLYKFAYFHQRQAWVPHHKFTGQLALHPDGSCGSGRLGFAIARKSMVASLSQDCSNKRNKNRFVSCISLGFCWWIFWILDSGINSIRRGPRFCANPRYLHVQSCHIMTLFMKKKSKASSNKTKTSEQCRVVTETGCYPGQQK